MDQLTIEHLAAYLPYGVNVYRASDIWTIHSVGVEDISISNGLHVQDLSLNDCFSDYSLLLHPLSDLSREITHNGDTFDPIERIKKITGIDASILPDVFIAAIPKVSYEVTKILHSWHFDTFGLIEAGLAIDINTIKQ